MGERRAARAPRAAPRRAARAPRASHRPAPADEPRRAARAPRASQRPASSSSAAGRGGRGRSARRWRSPARPRRRLGSKRVIQRRFNVSVPRARVPKKSIHASRPFREMIARPKISRIEWKTAEIGAFEVGNFALFCCPGGERETPRRLAFERPRRSSRLWCFAIGSGGSRLRHHDVVKKSSLLASGPNQAGRGSPTPSTGRQHPLLPTAQPSAAASRRRRRRVFRQARA